jgi:hypothetical protein
MNNNATTQKTATPSPFPTAPPRRKPRKPLGIFSPLNDEQRAAMYSWLTVDCLTYTQAVERVRTEFGVKTTGHSLCTLFQRYASGLIFLPPVNQKLPQSFVVTIPARQIRVMQCPDGSYMPLENVPPGLISESAQLKPIETLNPKKGKIMGFCHDEYVKRGGELVLETLRRSPEITFDAEFGDVDEINKRLETLFQTDASTASCAVHAAISQLEKQGIIKTKQLQTELRGDSGGKDFAISLTRTGRAYLGLLKLEFAGQDF